MINLLVALAALGLLVWIFKTHSRLQSSLRRSQWHGSEVVGIPARTETNDPDAAVQSGGNAPQSNAAPPDYSEINRAYRIAEMHFSRGDFAEAEKYFIKVLALHDAHTEALNRLGVIYIQQGNPRRAEILYRELLSITQKEPAYYCNYGRCLYNQGRLQDAIEAYENAIKLDATRSNRFVSVGQIYYEQKEFIKALAYFVRAVELEPTNVEYLTLTAELAKMVGDTERFQRSVKKIAEIDPYNELVKVQNSTQTDSPAP